jgi:hypothetical protein
MTPESMGTLLDLVLARGTAHGQSAQSLDPPGLRREPTADRGEHHQGIVDCVQTKSKGGQGQCPSLSHRRHLAQPLQA